MKRILKTIIYILIITLFLQRIYNWQTNTEAKEVQQLVLVSTVPYNCVFEQNGYSFKILDCEGYKPGTILKIKGALDVDFSREDSMSDTGFFEKKRLIIESIDDNQRLVSSPELWLKYLFFIFQRKKQSVLSEFLPIFDAEDGYLIGQLSLGFSQVRSKRVNHLFEVTGTQYLASISGFHLNIITRFFTNLVRNSFSKKLVGVVALVVSSLYLLFVGSKIPLVRAFLMLVFSVVLTSFLFRQNSSMRSLFLVATILIYIDISIINSISFQLSFVATASIIFFTNAFKDIKYFKSDKLANLHLSSFSSDDSIVKNTHISGIISNIYRYFLDSIKISLYVQIALLPLVIYHFNEFSFISLIVSVALTWLIPGLIMLALILIFFSLLEVNEIIFRIFALPLSFLSKLFLSILKLFDNQLFLIKIDSFPWWYLLVWWFFVILTTGFLTRKKRVLSLVECL